MVIDETCIFHDESYYLGLKDVFGATSHMMTEVGGGACCDEDMWRY